jgi:hypothetical protein
MMGTWDARLDLDRPDQPRPRRAAEDAGQLVRLEARDHADGLVARGLELAMAEVREQAKKPPKEPEQPRLLK